MATTRATLADPLILRLPEHLSAGALLALADANPTLRFEQSSRGYLIVSPPTGSLGNRGEMELVRQLGDWNRRTRFGEVRGLTGGVELPGGGQYQPDAFVIARSAWDALPLADRNKGYVPVLPAVVLALLSPSNKTAEGFSREFQEKLEDLERSRVPLVVLLDPEREATEVRRLKHEPETIRKPLVTFAELPGLELDVAAIFAACNTP
jgi:Uma2 family endonuclease